MKFTSKLNKEFKLEYEKKMKNGKVKTKNELLSIKFDERKCFSTINKINEITNLSTSYLLKPYCERNKYFDFLVWDVKKKYLYVFQITINNKHKKSEVILKKKRILNEYHPTNKDQIKFFWITLKDIDLSKIMKKGSFLIKFEKIKINKD